MGGFTWTRRRIAFVAMAGLMLFGALFGDSGSESRTRSNAEDRSDEADDSPAATTPSSSSSTSAPSSTASTSTFTTTTVTTTSAPRPPTLLTVIDRKDGDSFVASDGVEYRLGLVNTPELSEPCGRDAADFTYRFLADGFTAAGYETDTYGRVVAEVFAADGESLNVALAASGYGNDRYLDQFRHENPELAARLDAAFATASTPSCRSTTAAPQPFAPEPAPAAPPTPSAAPATGSGCHPAYSPCVPIQGDGSGRGDANDLDCGQIGRRVQVLDPADPYRLDSDGDGSGCESYG